MIPLTHIPLPDRALLRLDGPEAKDFLNGLISNDARHLGPEAPLFAALLSPQGKFLFELLLAEWQGAVWLDTEAATAPELEKKLKMYRLRAKVEIAPQAGWRGYALLNAGPDMAIPAEGFAFTDPRLAGLGQRLWLPEGVPPPGVPGEMAAYEALRLQLGVPDGTRDIERDKGLLLENHFEALNGVDFNKGCYVGQELTARTKYRGLVKKQLFQVQAETALPARGSLVLLDGQEAGELRTSLGNHGLALLRLEAVAKAAAGGQPLTCEGIALTARLPDYAAPKQ
ncbi:YgfZ/GcvT domain-containing protein [Ferrovibrio sp.]|uniref:CAF17-like 4Fe-4S cluster assembly/insertion protein YgfZ n=1 Tax=Ferrovibrio sp. TaxID=1917215 RepID=UPI003D0DA2D1